MARWRISRGSLAGPTFENLVRLQQYLLYFHEGTFAENGAAPATTAGDNAWHNWTVNNIQFQKWGGLDQSEVYVHFGVSNYIDIAAFAVSWRIQATHQDGTILTSDVMGFPCYFFHNQANIHIYHGHETHFGLLTNQTLKSGIWDFKIQARLNGLVNIKSDANDYNYMRITEVPMGAMGGPDF